MPSGLCSDGLRGNAGGADGGGQNGAGDSPMKCPDLCSGTPSGALRKRIIGYWRQVVRQNFRSGDHAYKYFAAWDIFHDSEIDIRKLDLKRGTVRMMLRNVYAVDRASSWQKQNRRGPKIRRGDFRTAIDFSGVTAFKCALGPEEGPPFYHCSSLMRRGESYELRILTQGWPRTCGAITIVFDRVHVENIFPRISKYTCGQRPRGLLSWLSRPAEYYLTAEGLKELLPF